MAKPSFASHNVFLNIIMVTFALDQDAEVVSVGSDEDAVENFVHVAIHQIEVFLDEVVIVEWIMNEAFEDVLVDDDDLLDDEVVLRYEFC